MNDRQKTDHEESILHWLVHRHAAIAGYSETKAGVGLPTDIDESDLAELQQAERCLQILDDLRHEHLGSNGDSQQVDSVDIGLPRRIGRFEIERELGRGGAGVVFLAFDPNLCRNVALKVPHPEAVISPEMRRRFLTEAEAAARLNHRNLISIYEVGQQGQLTYLTAEYCSGPSLAKWLHVREEPVSPHDGAAMFREIADGVAHAHSRGVLHRDLKPSNVLLADDSSESEKQAPESPVPRRLIPKVTDFGLAKLIEREDNATRTGIVLGTADYMAPEQAEGRVREIGIPSDVFAIGVMLYEVLCGKHPFRGESEAATLTKLLVGEFTPPQRIRRDIPADLAAICMKCLEREPGRRYQSANELSEDLSRFLDGKPTKARPIGVLERVLKWARRRPAWAAVSLLATVGIPVFTVTVLTLNTQLRGALDRAERNEAAIRERLYVADMADAFDAYAASDSQRVRELLERQTPAEGPTASLGWEWSLLNQLVHQEQRELPQPRAPVFSVAISPDGKLIASGDELSEVHIWDYTTGEHLRVIDTQQIEVNTVDFSPDSKLMATAGKDGTLRIWSVGRWNLVGEPLPHDEEVYCVAFAPNGQWFATGGRDKRLRAWRLGASQPEVEWEHPDDIEDLDISPDGQFIVTGCHDGHVRLWPRDEKEPIWDWEPDSEVASISCVRYTPDGRQVAVCPTRTQIQFLDSVDGHPLMPMEGVTSYVSTCRFTPDGTTIVFGCHDGSVHLRRAPSTTLYRSYDEANKVDVSPDGQFVASAGQAGSIDVFNTVAGEIVLHDGRGTGGPFPSVAISPDGKTLAYAGIAMSKWDLALGQQLAARGEDQWQLRKFRHLEYSPDGKLLAAAATDGTCRLYPADTYPNGEPAVVLERLVAGENGEGLVRDKEEMTCCDFSPDGSMIATSSNNDLVTLWDVKTGALLHEFKDHQADAVCVQFSPDGKLLAGGYQDGVTLLFDVESRELTHARRDHRDAVWTVLFSPDGTKLYSAGNEEIHAIDLQSGLRMGKPVHLGTRISWMEWLDQSKLIWSGDDFRVAIHRVTVLNADKAVSAHAGKLRAIAIAPDGKGFVTAAGDTVLRQWEVANVDTSSQVLRLGARDPAAVSISPDGSQFTTLRENTSRLEVHDVFDGRLAYVLDSSAAEIPVVRWSQDSAHIAVVHGTEVQIVSARDGDTITWLQGHAGDVTDIAFAPGGGLVATASLDKTVRLWQMPEGTPLATLNGHTRSVGRLAYSADGELLASSGDDRRIVVWNVESGKPLLEFSGHVVPTDLCFSPSGDWLASCADDGAVRIWSLDHGTQEHVINLVGDLKHLSFSPDGKTLAVGGVAAGLNLCHVETGRQLGTLLNQNHAVWDIRFDANGSLLAVDRDDQEETYLRKWAIQQNNSGSTKPFQGRVY